jgi:hypothetical protein
MGNNAKGFEFSKFATPRIIGGIAIAIIILWALSVIFGSPNGSSFKSITEINPERGITAITPRPTDETGSTHSSRPSAPATIGQDHQAGPADVRGSSAPATASAPVEGPPAPKHPPTASGQDTQTIDHGGDGPIAAPETTPLQPDLPATTVVAPVHKPATKGVAFVEAVIEPIRYELEERWWGWRPNDLINLTDNVGNFQMGVLEVTRRATVALAERISRTGSTASFDEDLEQAMNWFMVKASSYWLPSAESKYRDSLREMRTYLAKLKAGKAAFYTRTDNLIPLLASFEDLLGSCDENLVKEVHEDGSSVSFFVVDDYFYYAQGVASSMATVLEAVHHDFHQTLESRHATELLHHAIMSCQRAAAIDPWIVLDSKLSSVFANHRANMAAPISHARFYLGQLIKTLST